MLENFNDYFSIFLLISLLLLMVYIIFKLILNTLERNRIRKELEKSKKSEGDL